MLGRTRTMFFLSAAITATLGCQSVGSTGKKVGGFLIDAPFYVVDKLVDGLLEPDETTPERLAREQSEHKWRQHWRDHPAEVPAMTEAYKDDYR